MIHYFNPGHETAVLNQSKYYMAPANVVSMQKELAYLCAWYAKPEDYVLIENELSEEFTHIICRNNIDLPRPVTIQKISENKELYTNQKISLWGISPQAIHFFSTQKDEYQLNWDIPEWDNTLVRLSNRQTAKECLAYIIANNTNISPDILPRFYLSLEEIESEVNNSKVQLLAKAPYSSSGRGLLWLPIGGLTRTERQILHGHIKKQGSVSVENALDKKIDFAMEFRSDLGNIYFEGYSLFETNNKGAYLGNILLPQEKIRQKITQYIDASLLEDVKELLSHFIQKHISPVYDGYIGVDMMVYQQNNEYKLQPCLEINVRNNMGIVALHLCRNFISEQSSGKFMIDFNPKDGALFHDHKLKNNEHPLSVNNGRIEKGYLSLCPVSVTSRYRAYIWIDNKM
ncbi:hypothetical protein D0T53_10095 [Dysgonomonas sp. 216]|uniref:hypothetical protein n=1 Tax=Dysgonomonas sp. 216 TaxID=2302934 RepID=UPI0013D3A5F5|nr:hypothetical protein [Dysgonomonas sp. 216]NDW19263.1 hypothetical protein [Dysgonomonas sp. 216]